MIWIWRHLLLPTLANALALFITFHLLQDSGFMVSRGVFGFLIVGAVLGLLNTILKPLLKLVSAPLLLPTLGLILVAVNALILAATEYFFNDLFQDTFQVHFSVGNGLLSYLVAAVILMVANMLTHLLLRVRK